ncbi:uncharacterized protein LOC135400113 [Ornithodoros turicata]|uniref:uncharacterized protein LOC135400113 n=1 Tax=Ornithodoros turicata TaxID=34597 RepID=UPI003138B635
MWNRESSWLVMVFINSAVPLPLGETIVYPEFIESRSTSGQKILKITDDLVLSLEHKPAFGDQFTVTTVGDDGTEIHSIERGRDYNEEFFVDRAKQASLRISQDNGLEVHGIIGEAVRIEPIFVRSRSSRGQMAHRLVHERLKDMPQHLKYADTSPSNTTIEKSSTSTENLTDTAPLHTTIKSTTPTEGLTDTAPLHTTIKSTTSTEGLTDTAPLHTTIKSTTSTEGLTDTAPLHTTIKSTTSTEGLTDTSLPNTTTKKSPTSTENLTETSLPNTTTKKSPTSTENLTETSLPNTTTKKSPTSTENLTETSLPNTTTKKSPTSTENLTETSLPNTTTKKSPTSTENLTETSLPNTTTKKSPTSTENLTETSLPNTTTKKSPTSTENLTETSLPNTTTKKSPTSTENLTETSLPNTTTKKSPTATENLTETSLPNTTTKKSPTATENLTETSLPNTTTKKSPTSTENLTDTSPLDTTIEESPTSTESLSKQSDESISPEIHLVIDSALYRGFHNSTMKIFQYYGVVLNAVNLRFETITLLRVDVRITGFTIHTDFTEPYFDYRYYDGTTFISDVGTLQRFNQYYKINRTDTYNSSDIIFLITGQDVAFIHENVLFNRAEGSTYIGGACGNYKVGYCEDTAGSFDVVRRLSHEMGHSLGCTHDGADSATNIPNHPSATSCKWASGFLMTYVQEGLNQYKFSNCCANQMLFVSRLPNYQCLKDHTEASTTIAPPKVLPGSNTSLDEQCRHRHSKSQYNTYQTLNGCKLACVIPADEWNDDYYIWIPSLDGTPCDSNDTSMVCIRGECVSRPDYPYNPEVIPPFRSTTPRPPTAIRTTTTATKTNTSKKSWFHRAIDWCKKMLRKFGYGVRLTPWQRIFSSTHGSSGSKSS